MKMKLCSILLLAVALVAPRHALAWNATGHQLVARIAWDNMTPAARRNVVALLQAAPPDACLRNLMPTDARPLEVRQREFLMLASTWADIVRPRDDADPRACTRFHQRDWHFINYFWSGTSASTTDPPRDVSSVRTPEVNAVERFKFLVPFVRCGSPQDEQAIYTAWLLHLVGDIHQPLHTTARVTTRADERQGDQGGNLFKLGTGDNPPSLHGYWDGIIDRSMPRQTGERDQEYLARVAAMITTVHPRSSMSGRLQPIDFEAWAREGFATTKSSVYPRTLLRGQLPTETYRRQAFDISVERMALGGYRLAEVLNQLFGS